MPNALNSRKSAYNKKNTQLYEYAQWDVFELTEAWLFCRHGSVLKAIHLGPFKERARGEVYLAVDALHGGG